VQKSAARPAPRLPEPPLMNRAGTKGPTASSAERVRTVRSANHSAVTAAGSKRRFVIICRRAPSGIGLVLSTASGPGSNSDWESLTCASATSLELVAL
jgi:hypothetical protein